MDNTKQSKHGLSHQNAIYSDCNFKFQDVEDKFDINAILLKLDAKCPHLDFLQNLKIHYLETANMFESHFYQSLGMLNETVELFRAHVLKEYTKALLEHEQGKMERGGEHGTVPVFFS